jgi:hypothetical protein
MIAAPASAGSAADRGHRVARAAGKKQSRRKSAGRSASSARSGKPRAGAKRRAPAKKKLARASAAKRRVKRATPKRSAAPQRSVTRRTAAPRPAGARREPAPAAAVRQVVTPAFATQRAHASSREELLFELARARAAVKAAIQGLSIANASRPIAPGKWSPLEIVLHLGERDRVRLEEFHRTLHGQPRSWAETSDAEQAVQNEQHLSPLRALPWDSAVRRLDSLREQLLLRLHEVPALPDDVWQRGHAFADMMWGLPEHDRHHAVQIKRARTGEPVLTED